MSTSYSVPSAFQAYKKSMNLIRKMSEQEKSACMNDLLSDDESVRLKARNRLTEVNLPLVIHAAVKFANDETMLMDLIQEGNQGLMYAMTKFDPTLGFAISTYSLNWINRYIINFKYQNKRVIRLPMDMAKLTEKVAKIQRQDPQELKVQIEERLAAVTGASVSNVKFAMYFARSTEIESGLVDIECYPDIDEQIDMKKKSAWLHSKVSELKGNKREIMRLHLSNDGVKPLTYAAMAEGLNLSKQIFSKTVISMTEVFSELARDEMIA
jgi:RNA polymerase sigma factor (sigma-70 family)